MSQAGRRKWKFSIMGSIGDLHFKGSGIDAEASQGGGGRLAAGGVEEGEELGTEGEEESGCEGPEVEIAAGAVADGFDLSLFDAIEFVVDVDELFAVLGEEVAAAGLGGDLFEGLFVEFIFADGGGIAHGDGVDGDVGG